MVASYFMLAVCENMEVVIRVKVLPNIDSIVEIF